MSMDPCRMKAWCMMSTEMYDPNVKAVVNLDPGVEGGEGTRDRGIKRIIPMMYASAFYGRLQKSNLKIREENNVESLLPPAVSGEDPRGEWLAATSLSPWDGTTVYHEFSICVEDI